MKLKFIIFVLIALINSFDGFSQKKEWEAFLGVNSVIRSIDAPSFLDITYYTASYGIKMNYNEDTYFTGRYLHSYMTTNYQTSRGLSLGIDKDINIDFMSHFPVKISIPIEFLYLKQRYSIFSPLAEANVYALVASARIVAFPENRIKPFIGMGYLVGYFDVVKGAKKSKFINSFSELISFGIYLKL